MAPKSEDKTDFHSSQPLPPATDQDVAKVQTTSEHSGRPPDEDDSVAVYRKALTSMPENHHQRWPLINKLAGTLETRFERERQLQDLDEAVSLYREALNLRLPPHPLGSSSLNCLAAALHTRFEQKDQLPDLNESIQLYREALNHLSALDLNRSTAINNLADALQARFTRTRQLPDLNEAISLRRQTLVLRPAHDRSRLSALNNLAAAIHDRFRETSQPGDVDEAISLHRNALSLRSANDPNRSTSLNNLAAALKGRFDRSGQIADLEEAVSLHREALVLRSSPHPLRWSTLNNLALALEARFKQAGQLVDVDEAVVLYREALGHLPLHHPHRSISLKNLAVALYSRYDDTRQLHDLDEAVFLHRKALGLLPAHDLNRPSALINLAATLHNRFRQVRQPSDLDEAVMLYREAFADLPTNHPHRSITLYNLAMALHSQCKHTNQTENLEEVISLYQAALDMMPVTHIERWSLVHSLALAHKTQFNFSGQLSDIEEALTLCRQALHMLPEDHPSNCTVSITLGRLLLDRILRTHELENMIEEQWGDVVSAMDIFRKAANRESSPVSDRFIAARIWVRLQDICHDVHGSALDAYKTAISLLPRMALLGLDVQSRQEALTANTFGLARDAAACAIEEHRIDKAIEFLEEGRAVFWSQALQLRTPLDQLKAVAPDLAQTLEGVSHALEQGSLRDISANIVDPPEKAVSEEREKIRYRQLNATWQSTVEEVRQLDGFRDFLLPKSFAALSAAAANGPVVILNAGSFRLKCDALILRFSEDPIHIPLPRFTPKRAEQLVRRIRTVPDAPLPLARGDRHIHRPHPKGWDPDSVFRNVLAELWKFVVQPILHVLNLEKSSSPPRIWWLSTGPFASLPIHAAGIYDPPEIECVSDYVISSYTTTLSALLTPPSVASEPFKMVAAIQPLTKGQDSLPCTEEELLKIEQHVPSTCLVKFGIPTSPAYVRDVILALSSASIVHFACHGVQDVKNPLDSALLLEDDRLKVSQLMNLTMSKASLVFLSACQTAMVDEDLPDESVHLAATLLFSGFQGAVATMWSIQDRDGPMVADSFYEYLFSVPESANADVAPPPLDVTRAAHALHFAVAKLRSENCSFVRWVPFIHLGL